MDKIPVMYRIRFALYFWRKMKPLFSLKQAWNYPRNPQWFGSDPIKEADAEIEFLCN